MTSLLQDVVRRGTAARAMQLGRLDLAGKTGTTNDQVDAWFTGFQPSLVAIAWIGFDQPRTLGGTETGAQAALPIWMNYMAKALKGVPEAVFTVPEGVAVAKIDAQTGLPVPEGQDGLVEYFYQENVPSAQAGGSAGAKPAEEVKDQLF
jgi:penicillin-binding protein 1A